MCLPDVKCVGRRVKSLRHNQDIVDNQAEIQLAQLIRNQRWACLATLHVGVPFASFVAYVPDEDFSGFLIHISRLAPHTGNLLAEPRATLAITEQDKGDEDPQTLARVSIQGGVIELMRNSSDYQRARAHYLRRLPYAEQLFTFEDFILFRLIPSQARYIAGFARTWNINPEQLRTIAVSTIVKE